MDRKLASIQKVLDLSPIYLRETMEEAESICLARVLGWSVVVKKNEFQVGDLCVFFEIDSILPEVEWSEFLRDKHFHVKTMKLNKFRYAFVNAPVISQGLALPITTFSNNSAFTELWATTEVLEGADVTEVLGVYKYEAPVPAQLQKGIKAWNFHPIIPKTDEPRVQSYPALLEQLQGKPYYITQKLDGSSVTIVNDSTGLHVYSRNLEVGEESLYWQTAEKQGIIKACLDNPGLGFQGELIGEGIQKNRLGLKGNHICIFNIYDLTLNRYHHYKNMLDLLSLFRIPCVPLLDFGDYFDYNLDKLLEIADGTYQNGFPQEGIVVRSSVEGIAKGFERLSFKVINPNFLLKIGE